jgi:hypothetical protein
MAKITYYLTDTSHLDSIEVNAGNLLFCEDTRVIYLDGENGRVAYDSIMVFETDEDRFIYPNPQVGFYYVEETKVLWRYDGAEWKSITEPPTHNVVFIPKSELPAQGEFAVLYICDNEMFVWLDDQYVSLNSESVWHEV